MLLILLGDGDEGLILTDEPRDLIGDLSQLGPSASRSPASVI